MQQKEGNPVPARKGIRERIMDCLSPQTDKGSTQKMLDDEEKENEKLMAHCLRETTRNQLSVVWNNFRYKKWGDHSELPPIEELEEKLMDIVPQYSGL